VFRHHKYIKNDQNRVILQSFDSKKAKKLGEELINEELQQFIGKYTKQIDLTNLRN
jgi:hypothetical protein